jgi:hypothetical protein
MNIDTNQPDTHAHSARMCAGTQVWTSVAAPAMGQVCARAHGDFIYDPVPEWRLKRQREKTHTLSSTTHDLLHARTQRVKY